MANLNNAVIKAKFTTKDGEFKDFEKLINRLEDAVEEMPETIDKWTLDDATQMSRNLTTAYQNYLSSLPDKEKKDLHTATTYITKINGGYNVAISGKDILYHEFGTGDQGAWSGYPSKKALQLHNYEYNAGPKVIHAGEADDYLSYQDLPNWYIGFIGKHPNLGNRNWWMSPHGISNGIPAGAFTYDTYSTFYNDLQSDQESAKWSLGKKSVHLKVRNKITKGKWK